MTQAGSTPDQPQPSAVPERSGADIAEAIDVAAAQTPDAGVQRPPHEAKPHAAPVEQVREDPDMTQGRVVEAGGTATTPDNPDPALAGSGGAQSVVGARVSDRLAAGEGAPDGPPFQQG